MATGLSIISNGGVPLPHDGGMGDEPLPRGGDGKDDLLILHLHELVRLLLRMRTLQLRQLS